MEPAVEANRFLVQLGSLMNVAPSPRSDTTATHEVGEVTEEETTRLEAKVDKLERLQSQDHSFFTGSFRKLRSRVDQIDNDLLHVAKGRPYTGGSNGVPPQVADGLKLAHRRIEALTQKLEDEQRRTFRTEQALADVTRRLESNAAKLEASFEAKLEAAVEAKVAEVVDAKVKQAVDAALATVGVELSTMVEKELKRRHDVAMQARTEKSKATREKHKREAEAVAASQRLRLM